MRENITTYSVENSLQPREKMCKSGIEVLSDQDLVALIIGSGGPQASVHELSREVLKRFLKEGDLLKHLTEIQGMGNAGAGRIMAALELGRRFNGHRKKPVNHPTQAFDMLRHFGDRPQEQFFSLALNGAYELIDLRRVSVGLVNRTLVHPREVFSHAVEKRAAAVVVAHNHPSGKLKPSQEDFQVTERIKSAGELLGIPLLDHLIFDHSGFYSFMEEGGFR
jgi:DNA repair protein RadC